MKVIVFGATGPTGREVVKQGLELGRDVTAFVRDLSALDIDDPHLRMVQGDVMDADTVIPALAGQDAVVSALGSHSRKGPVTVYSVGVANILQGMTEHGLRRIACVSAGGVGNPKDPNLPWVYRKIILGGFMKEIYADMERMEKLIQAGDTEWTIVRPAGLSDEPLTAEYRVAEGTSLPHGSRISRADLAAFLLKAVRSPEYVRKAVAIAY
jgi:putative NADH-flavin reductase